jgi:hypothetical protein
MDLVVRDAHGATHHHQRVQIGGAWWNLTEIDPTRSELMPSRVSPVRDGAWAFEGDVLEQVDAPRLPSDADQQLLLRYAAPQWMGWDAVSRQAQLGTRQHVPVPARAARRSSL